MATFRPLPEGPPPDDPADAALLRAAARLLGRKGGQATRDRHGTDHYRRAGLLGGEAVEATHGRNHYRVIGKMAGDARLARYGRDYFVAMGRMGGLAGRGVKRPRGGTP